ncbi:MAG: hypothetical protein ACSW8K_11900 [bacterium]
MNSSNKNMTALYEIREKVADFINQFEYILIPAGKFLITMALLFLINSSIGYFEMLTDPLLMTIISLACALVPIGFTPAALSVVILAHLYTVSYEVLIFGAVLILVIFLLYFRFSPRDTVLLLLMPIAYRLNLHYAVPLIGGLLCTPGAAAPVAIGVVMISFVQTVSEGKDVFSSSEVGVETITNFQNLANIFLHNKAMWVMALALAVTVVIVYVIRRLAITQAWAVAIVVGTVTELILLLIGDMRFSTNFSFGTIFLGVVVSFGIAMLVRFIAFNVDYSRIESVQFEDDDYYYYVKAVPKVMLPTARRTVKTISRSGRTWTPGENGSTGEKKPSFRDSMKNLSDKAAAWKNRKGKDSKE